MSSTSTTESTGAKVATSEKPRTGKGKSSANTSTQYELLPQQQATENGGLVPTVETENSNVADIVVTTTKKVKAAAGKSNPKKVEASAAKAKPKKAETATAKSQKAEATAAKSKPEKVAKKKAVSTVKGVAANGKKVKLAASTYHYYRNFLAEFMRSHGVPSANFQKSAESYDGHITVSETEKAKGLKALEQWSKQNPDTRELFWDIKK